MNDQRFWTPHLIKKWDKDKGGECNPSAGLMDKLQEFWPQQ